TADARKRGEAQLSRPAPEPDPADRVVGPLDPQPRPRLGPTVAGLEDRAGDFLAADERRVDPLTRQPGRRARRIADEVHTVREVEADEVDLDRCALVLRLAGVDADRFHPPVEVGPDRRRRDELL